MKKILIILAILLALGAVGIYIGYKYYYIKPHTDYASKEAEVKIVAKRLWLDYSMNKDIASPRYDDKIIEINGTIMNLEEANNQIIVVFAFKRGDFGDEGIRVTMLPEYKQAAKAINPFKPIKIKAHCIGFNGQDVLMDNGSIVEAQK